RTPNPRFGLKSDCDLTIKGLIPGDAGQCVALLATDKAVPVTSVPGGNSDAKTQFWVLALILFAGYCFSSTLSSLSDKWMMKNLQRGPYDFGL
ncbi:hypothetical protein QYM36_019692, partial [Artemia franciscana]